MSVDLERATTRNLLDGLRSYLTTFEIQLDSIRQDENSTAMDSRDGRVHPVHFGDLLPRLQAYSFVTLLALIVEVRLSVFCRTVQQDYALATGIDDLAGDLFARAFAFLAQSLSLEPPQNLWQWLSDVMLIRDCIVHTGGSIQALSRSDRLEIHSIVRRRPGLAVESDSLLFSHRPQAGCLGQQILRVELEFCSDAVTAAQGLIGYLYQHREPGT